MTQETLDTFMCVHSRDIDYLLRPSLKSFEQNFPRRGKFTVVTNEPDVLRAFLRENNLVANANVTGDRDWLSEAEMELPGWFRQQLIKLRAYKFCDTDNFCNLGADTILLRPINTSDLIDQGRPVTYYSRHRMPDRHYKFEQARVKNVSTILQVDPVESLRYVDFINDFFCFNRQWLMALDAYVTSTYGPDPYVSVLKGLSARTDQEKFGEWTLYSVFVLDYLKERPTIRDASTNYLSQVHGRLDMLFNPLRGKIVHFVQKSFSKQAVRRKLLKANAGAASFIDASL